MKLHLRVLPNERRLQIAAATKKWYETIPRGQKRQICTEFLGCQPNQVDAWLSGKRPVPPVAMRGLYLLTKNSVFLMSAAEKDDYRHRKHKVPVNTDWPDSDTSGGTELAEGEKPPAPPPKRLKLNGQEARSVAEIKRMALNLSYEIQRLADLPENDPAREEARRELVEPAMALFYATQKLRLQFPTAFDDFLEAMKVAMGMIGET